MDPALPSDERLKKAPRWTVAFLRALERTGEVRAATADAGVDHTTAYLRRKAHGDFAFEWDGALERHAEAKLRGEEEAVGSLPDPSPQPLSRAGRGAQVRRAGHDRWSERKEKLFFEELAATANVKMAAKAAGVSTTAVYARRMRERLFREKWAAVLESARAAIEMNLLAAANRSFDPDEIDTGDIEPRVSVADAIKITQMHGSSKPEGERLDSDRYAYPRPYDIEEVRQKLEKKIMVLREEWFAEAAADGWSHDAEHDCMVPPGWVRA